MSLTSTLFTGLSGLNVNQSRLNVVGNNIANVNTVGFKGSRAIFKPQFYVTDRAGTAPTGEFGGSNPSQRGLGAVVATIEKEFSQGSIEPTGKSTDLALDGEGFFVVQGKEIAYTRDGSFDLNSENFLTNSSGMYVKGFAADAAGNIIPGVLENMQVPLGQMTIAQQSTRIANTGNLNTAGEIGTGASILNSQPLTVVGGGAPVTNATPLSDVRLASAPGGAALFAPGDTISLEGQRGGRDQPLLTYTVGAGDTLADLATFFNNALGIDATATPPAGAPTPGAAVTPALGGDPANSARFTLIGNVGEVSEIAVTDSKFSSSNAAMTLGFVGGSDGTYTDGPVGESVNTTAIAYDSLGNPLEVQLSMVLREKTPAGTTWDFIATSNSDTDSLDPFVPGAHEGPVLGGGSVSFDTSGRFLNSTGTTINLDRDNTGAAADMAIDLDFTALTALADDAQQGRSLLFGQADGKQMGTLSSFTIGDTGIITGSFDNGLTLSLGQIAVATFDNPKGLNDVGGNLFLNGAASGTPRISAPLEATAGGIRSGSLEMSNVDLSEEFINMIISSTGFSAASRVITTSDQLMTELLNASR
ncbi:MAG: flagellar hook protein FlgE [Phycisphaerae bacterium]